MRWSVNDRHFIRICKFSSCCACRVSLRYRKMHVLLARKLLLLMTCWQQEVGKSDSRCSSYNKWIYCAFLICLLTNLVIYSVASLRLVSPGTATDGVTLFFPQNWRPVFSRRSLEPDDLFGYHLVTTTTHLSTFQRVFFHSGVAPSMVSPRAVCPPPLVMPLDIFVLIRAVVL